MTITERIDAITGIPDEYRRPDPPCPRSVKIELTGRCNFACSFCARSMRLRRQADMDKELFSRLVREMREAGVEELGLFYLGESFMVDWLPWAVEFAKVECGFPYVFLTTNGSLAAPGRVRACMEAGLDSLKFSLNYADEQQFQAVTKVKPTMFDVVERNVLGARAVRDEVEKETGHRCGVYASYIEYDGDQGRRIHTYATRLRKHVDEMYALPLYNQAALVTKREKELGWKPTAGNRGRSGALREPLPCWALFTEGHITWDGLLSGCCFDHTTEVTMADLNEVDFMEGWHSGRFLSLRRANLDKDVRGTPCETCVAYN